MDKNKFYYCYSPKVYNLLKSKEIACICSGLHRKTLKSFWQYERTLELENALTEFREMGTVMRIE